MKKFMYAIIMLFLSTLLIACSSNKHEIIFDSMGGSRVEAVKVENGTVIPIPEVTRIGYMLEGWYTSVDGGESLNEEWLFSTDTVIQDLTLYAKWALEGLVFDQETGSITDYKGEAKDIIIPSEINGTPVTTVGKSVFSRHFLSSVTIPDSVTEIGDFAFAFSSFSSLTIPDSVTKIGDSAFYNGSLRSLTIPDSVTTIGEGAFLNNDLTSITILGDEARFDEDWVKIGLPAEYNPRVIKENGFLFVDDLNEIIGYIGDDKEIIIPSEINGIEVTKIGYGAFYEKDITSVTIPASVTKIGSYAFYSNDLTSVTIPDAVTKIGSYTFYSNDLTSVTIPDAVTTIGDWAFSVNALTSIVIPNNVVTIGERAFGSNALTSVTIPDSVITLGERAFESNDLISIVIPDSITTIGEKTFARNALTSVTIPDSITTIGESAFASNDITSIIIPESVTTIGEDAFAVNHITSTTSITILGDETRFDEDWVKIGLPAEYNPRFIMENGFIFYPDTKTMIGYIGDDEDIVIPSNIKGIEVMHIGFGAFSSKDLNSVKIPDSVITIASFAFSGNGLTSIIISDRVTTIGDLAFFSNDLTSITIPDTVTTIGDSAFSNNRIASLTIPDSVTTIGNRAFHDNPIITIIILGDEIRFNDNWENIGFPEDKKPESE